LLLVIVGSVAHKPLYMEDLKVAYTFETLATVPTDTLCKDPRAESKEQNKHKYIKI
jgi:hypothetical protein